ISGTALLSRLREQVGRYDVRFIEEPVERVEELGGELACHGRTTIVRSQRLMLATGIVDRTPTLPRLRQSLDNGRLRLCPVCDGFEAIGAELAVIGPEDRALGE